MNAKGTLRAYHSLIYAIILVIGAATDSNAQNDALYFSPGENLVEKTGKYLFIKVLTDKKEAFVGECIIAEYRLYVATEIEGKLARSPSFTGFAVYDMLSDNNTNYNVEKIGGITFRVYLIRKLQLYGLAPGVQHLLPVELDATIRYLQQKPEKKSVPETIYFKQKDTTLLYVAKSPSVDLKINPLPKNDNKTYAVGDYKISSSLSSVRVEAGKADTLFLTIQGAGNWHDVTHPEINWPDGFEIFEPAVVEDLNPGEAPLTGSKIFAYPIVASNKGSYTIPAVAFTFFNPYKKKYLSIQTNPLPLEALPATQNSETASTGKNRQDLPLIFTRYGAYLFPIAALCLIVVILFNIFYRRGKKE